MSNFFSFNIPYKEQLKNNWCWCACFSWIIKALELETLSKEQWQILLHYTQHINNNLIITQDNREWIEASDSPTNLLIKFTNGEISALIRSLLKLEFELIEVPSRDNEKIETLNRLFNYQALKNSLKTLKAPWIVTTDNHMYLITGFGEDECGEYVLVSDPNKEKKETFFSSNKFINEIAKQITNIWILKNPDGEDIKKDKLIEKYKLPLMSIDPSIPTEMVQPYFQSGAGLLKLNQKINRTIQNYNGNASGQLKNLIHADLNNSMLHFLCESYILKTNQPNIQTIERVLEHYLKTSTFDIDLNELKLPQQINTHHNLRLLDLNQEIHLIPDEALIRFQNLSEILTKNTNF